MYAPRVIEKTEETAYNMPCSCILTPACLRESDITEIEFLVEHIHSYNDGEESLRVGICTGAAFGIPVLHMNADAFEHVSGLVCIYLLQSTCTCA